MNISSSGLMTISYQYSGYPSITTKAVITTYIEKRTLGIFWSRVDIGTSDNQWNDVINDYRYTGYRTYQLSDKGTYRVVVKYTIYGTGGSADVIPYEAKDSYYEQISRQIADCQNLLGAWMNSDRRRLSSDGT